MPGPHQVSRRALLAGTAGLAATTAAVTLPGLTGSAAAAVPAPAIDSTADWDARPPGGGIDVLPDSPVKIIVHHSVSENVTDYSRAQAHAHAHWVQDLHMDDNGWVDTGYHFVISRGGYITEGRHGSLDALTAGSGHVIGAHTSGQNYDALGICNEGAYHDGATPPEAQWEALVSLCAYACQQYNIAPFEIYGHLDFGSTLCPGIYHDMLPQLRAEVEAAVS